MNGEPLRSRTGRLTLIFLLFVAVAVSVSTALSSDTSATSVGGPMEGETAPEVVLDTFGGDTWRLSQHLSDDGRRVVLNLWASWCEPCKEEIPELSRFADAHPDVAVIGVAVRDEPDAARLLAEELDPAYLVGVDGTDRLRDRYVGFGLPATFIIDETGIIVAQMEGPVTAELLEEVIRR